MGEQEACLDFQCKLFHHFRSSLDVCLNKLGELVVRLAVWLGEQRAVRFRDSESK